MEQDLTFQVLKMLSDGMSREEINKALNINLSESGISRLQDILTKAIKAKDGYKEYLEEFYNLNDEAKAGKSKPVDLTKLDKPQEPPLATW